MKSKSFAIALLLLCCLPVLAQQSGSTTTGSQHRLMPVPAAMQWQSGRLKIDAAFTAAIDGYTDARLEAGVFRMTRRLEGRTGFEFSRNPTVDKQSAIL